MLSLFYFFLVHCFVLPTTDLRIQAVCTQNCCTSYDLYAVVLSLFPIILSLLVPIILKKEFYTYDLCILRCMFIVATDDKPRNRFYYKHVSVLYRRPSYFVSITMSTLLMSSTGLCPCISLSVSRYCHMRWTEVSVLGTPRLVLQCGNSTFVDRAYRWCRGVAASVFWQTIKNNRT